jgi:acyl-coenzyme A thioesterase PaaI-like protein
MYRRRQSRHDQLRRLLAAEPLLTDEDLARQLGVSIPTVRLDRLDLGIPEVRQRSRQLALQALREVRSLEGDELVGDLVELELGRRGASVLVTTPAMAFQRTGIVRSHFIFAQADSLALAVIDGEVALTGLVNSKFKRPVRAGERLRADAEIIRRRRHRFVVLVVTRVGEEIVFRAKFLVVALPAAAVARASSLPALTPGED